MLNAVSVIHNNNYQFCLFLDAGAPVYVYEFQHAPSILQKKRPSFVGSDHGDEIAFVFGFCFADGLIKLEGTTTIQRHISEPSQ